MLNTCIRSVVLIPSDWSVCFSSGWVTSAPNSPLGLGVFPFLMSPWASTIYEQGFDEGWGCGDGRILLCFPLWSEVHQQGYSAEMDQGVPKCRWSWTRCCSFTGCCLSGKGRHPENLITFWMIFRLYHCPFANTSLNLPSQLFGLSASHLGSIQWSSDEQSIVI